MTLTLDRPVTPQAPPGRRWSEQRRATMAGYAFLAPWLVGFFGITALPMLASLVLSFTNFSGSLRNVESIGLENYRIMFTVDPAYWGSVRVTFLYVFLSVPVMLVFALAVAAMLNKGLRALGLYRAIFYVPSLLGGSVAVAVLWRFVSGASGLVNDVLGVLGLESGSWIGNPDTALVTIMVLNVWTFGSPMIIFLAGLRQVPPELYEAASLDGAGRWQRFRHITMPSISPVVLFNGILALIGGFQAFTQVYACAAAPVTRPDRRCSTRCCSTSGRSPSCASATRRRWRGCCSSSSRRRPRWCSRAGGSGCTTGTSRERPRHPAPRSRREPVPPHVQRVLVHVCLVSAAFVMIYPLLWMTASALRPSAQVLVEDSLWVSEPTLENFAHGWTSTVGTTSFGLFAVNSLVIAVLSVVGNVVSCALAAYAFARLPFHGRKVWFALMVGTIMLPYHVLLIPQYLLFNALGWVDTFLPLVVPKFLATEAFFVFLLVQFFRLIPKELIEAARIDGCGHPRIFLRIIVPLSVPALATTAAFSFIWAWNDFLNPLIYLTSPSNYTVPIGLAMFVDTSGTSNYGALFAMSLLSLLPVIGFFLAFQRLLLDGISTTGLK